MADIQSLLQLEDSYDFVLNLFFGDSKFLTQVIIYAQMHLPILIMCIFIMPIVIIPIIAM